MRALALGLLTLAWTGSCAPTVEQSRAVTLADCVAHRVLSLPEQADDLDLALEVLDSVRACRRQAGADAGAQ